MVRNKTVLNYPAMENQFPQIKTTDKNIFCWNNKAAKFLHKETF